MKPARLRSDFALRDLFGASRSGEIQGPVANYGSYARIERRHEILNGFEQTNWIPGAQYVVPVKTGTDSPVLTVVRANSGYPPEMAYTEESHTQQPAVVLREKGASRLVYFPGDYERSGWRSGNADISQTAPEYHSFGPCKIARQWSSPAKAWSNCSRGKPIRLCRAHSKLQQSQSSSRLDPAALSDRAANRQNEAAPRSQDCTSATPARGTGNSICPKMVRPLNSPCGVTDYEVAALTAV